MATLEQQQFLPVSPAEAWAFFATPRNLARITPGSMEFTITSEVPDEMYEGLVITYRVKPLWGIPLRWWSIITRYQPLTCFVDEQTKGPFKKWRHEHHFEATPGGVLMTDIVDYDIGWSFLGKWAQGLVVEKKLRQIFDHRRRILEKTFPQKNL